MPYSEERVFSVPPEEITPDIMGFVETYLDCFVSWDILAYFHDNPDVERTLSGIAIDIGRRPSAIEASLNQLVKQGVLRMDESEGDEASYRYGAGMEFEELMERFATATRDRTNRLAVVSMVLQKEAKRL